MADRLGSPSDNRAAGSNDGPLRAPAISLPKGGGAVRGIGEKFASNPVTGTGSLTIPVATSPGRSGFGPQLSLSYDSGAGNGPFGLGWNLSLPFITRKTEKGLPRYRDAEESDEFILAGSEDLVPALVAAIPLRALDGQTYDVRRYRPRVEGLFARIEHWTNVADPRDTFWRTISRENVTTYYGRTAESRLADPADPRRILTWHICESADNKGNLIAYRYKSEDSAGVDRSLSHEANRTGESRSANRYLKRIQYGNGTAAVPADWMFEVVFDYGEHDVAAPGPNDTGEWPARNDPFSSYRGAFEVRTYRLCRRVLMFHHIPEAEADGVGANCLVRSTDLTYRHERDTTDRRNPICSVLTSVAQAGYRRAEGEYTREAFPPLEFEYSEATIHDEIRDLDPESLENLPFGVDHGHYQWVDLDGEGVSGVLTQQAGGLLYKPNLSPLSTGAQLGSLRQLDEKPSVIALTNGHQQLLDLAGDGQLDLIELAGPRPGFQERTDDKGWDVFRAFTALPAIDWGNPNLRFIDLTGDGHADILISEDDAFCWHPSFGEAGFGAAERVRKALDDEQGARLVFADGTQSVYLADFSGDGLADLARVRNGEVCYWPNLGYGRFGRKVTMDNAPWFDAPDLFDQRRIRLADIDGSGLTDILYLGRDAVQIYFNHSGNGWSDARDLRAYPQVDQLTAVAALDLLGNGTACLVWSSPLPGEARRATRYIDLMGGQKPHLLVAARNNLGLETRTYYAPSTKFYLADKRAGTPWITRLPFPVHVVEKLTVTDRWRQTTFATTFSYRHGYFDGVEREFRGFGRVDQVDVESFGEFAEGHVDSPFITVDKTLYQPPVKTVTWFHTGVFLDRERILSQYKDEYFSPEPGAFREHTLPEPVLDPSDLTAEEWREALRACKGMMLRQEVYELDVDNLERGQQRPVKLLSTAFHNCQIRRLQPRGTNRHPVFLAVESEALTYHYELDLRSGALAPDPRVSHALNIDVDEYGHVRRAAAIAYPRLGRHTDALLPAGAEDLIARVQQETHMVFTDTSYTSDVDALDAHRLRVPCDTRTYEVSGVTPAHGYFTIDQLREPPAGSRPQTLQHHRMLFFDEDLRGPLPFGSLNALGLPYGTFKLALTDEQLSDVFSDKLTLELRAQLSEPSTSGYLSGPALGAHFAGADTAGQYWIPSGTAGFEPDAAEHFYLPERYADPFGNVTVLQYDSRDMYLESSTDPVGNQVSVLAFDWRVLAPRDMRDANGNVSQIAFDVLGKPSALALRGKGDEGDALDDFAPTDLADAFDPAEARRLLGRATTRYVYDFGAADRPAGAATILRERHAADLAPGEDSPLQVAVEYSDGAGTVLVKKMQAEPAPGSATPRWITSGRTVLNNKGKPVKQYEPYFSENAYRFEQPLAIGITPLLYYDALGRLIRVELPNGSVSRVALTPWHVASYDPNDTVLEPECRWYAERTAATASAEDRRAARLAAEHANTPVVAILDSLGREVGALTHNKVRDVSGTLRDEKHLTFTTLNAEGKPLSVRDARGNVVMQMSYDLAGNLLFQRSMDSGDRWMLNDAAGKPLFAWDINDRTTDDGAVVTEERTFRTSYDALHRPTGHQLRVGEGPWQVIERFEYGEGQPDDELRNLRGQLHQHHDSAGFLRNDRFDFAGKLLEVQRRLASDYQAPVIDWSDGSPTAGLEAETFAKYSEYDALGRITREYNWHADPNRVAVYEPHYNQRGTLEREDLIVRAARTGTGYAGGTRTPAIVAISYNAKGQREQVAYANGAVTTYEYDPQMCRLNRLATTRPHPDNGQRTVQDLRFTYDAVGNITEIRDEAQQTVFYANTRVEPHTRYAYDALYRLTRAEGREHAAQNTMQRDARRFETVVGIPFPNSPEALQTYSEEYEYDAAGNIRRMRHIGGSAERWTRRYEYAADSNRLLGTSLPGDSGDVCSARCQYDPHGSLLNLNRTPEDYQLRWDYRDMIRAVNRGGGGWAHYSYDAAKQRARKVITNGSTKQWERFYLGGLEVYRRYGAGGVVEELESHHLMVEDQRVLLVEDVLSTDNPALGAGTRYRYQLNNQLGSTTVTLDEHAAVMAYEEYHPFGTTSYDAGGSAVKVSLKRYRYTGMERDEETGLSYHSARYYAPWLGRWCSTDPSGIKDGPNLYAYCHNRPVVGIDRTGQIVWVIVIVAAVVAVFMVPDIASDDPEHQRGDTELFAETAAWAALGATSGLAEEAMFMRITGGEATTFLTTLGARAAGGTIGGGIFGFGGTAIDDASAGELSSPEVYIINTTVGAAGGGFLGGGFATATGGGRYVLTAIGSRIVRSAAPAAADTFEGVLAGLLARGRGAPAGSSISASREVVEFLAEAIYRRSAILQRLSGFLRELAGLEGDELAEAMTRLRPEIEAAIQEATGLTIEIVEPGTIQAATGSRGNYASLGTRPGYLQIERQILEDPAQLMAEYIHETGAFEIYRLFGGYGSPIPTFTTGFEHLGASGALTHALDAVVRRMSRLP